MKWSSSPQIKLAILLLFVILFAVGMAQVLFKSDTSRALSVWVFERPTSIDPIDYDAFVHHVTFRAVLSGLVSQYKKGGYVGVLAKRWSASPDFKTWEFDIRSNLQFEDGTPISAEIIEKNFRRLAYIMHLRASKSELFHNLKSYFPPSSASSPISGMTSSGSKLRFEFSVSMPKLLELLSFGIYAVLSPADYDPQSGKMYDVRRALASGHYRITSWSDKILHLDLRHEFIDDARHPNAYSSIKIEWGRDAKNTSDIVVGMATEELGSDRTFVGPAPSNIIYIHCLSWHKKDSPFVSREFRTRLRNAFYEKLSENGVPHVKSFFPLAMKDISQFSYDSSLSKSSLGDKTSPSTYVASMSFRNTVSLAAPKLKAELAAFLEDNFSSVESREDISFKDLGDYLNLQKADLDFTSVVTGILVEDPYNDIRFMFQSKEGIRLPDEDGSIHRVLEHSTFNAAKINELIWDQAIVWPIGHTAMGLWVRDGIDTNLLNTILPPTDFSWIGKSK